MKTKSTQEYPCIKIGHTLHITISGTECLCGLRYQYANIDEKKLKIEISHPLLRRTLSEVSCPECRAIAAAIDM